MSTDRRIRFTAPGARTPADHLEATASDRGTVIHDRTPFVIIELQLRPPPPLDARPLFWGAGMLTFYDRDRTGFKVWEQNVGLLTGRSSHASHVRKADHGGGWVLVLTLTHDRAREALDGMGLPYFVEGGS